MQDSRVFLVGAGAGDPELLTLKALNLIKAADVVVYDRLVSDAVLDMVPKGVSRINVGKRPCHHPVPQEEINKTLIRLAKAGHMVVRLKGGDPFIFGRGGEEALALSSAGIPVEVVPGITSAQACAAKLCMPLTHRGLSHSVRYITGHYRQDKPLDLDWNGLADPDTTLAIYMGLASIGRIAGELVRHGRDPATPVLVVSRGTLEDERHFVSTLARIKEDTRIADIPTPTLFLVGEVVRLSEILRRTSDVQQFSQILSAE